MELIGNNRRAVVLIAAGLALAVVAALMLLHRSHGDDHGGTVVGKPAPGASGGDLLHPRGDTGKAGKGRKAARAGRTGSGVGTSRSFGGFPGLPGHSLSARLPVIRIQLTVESAMPIGTVGYVIPTSQDHTSGKVTGVGRSWSLTTTGYGKPDYARIFFGAGPSGVPVTCTIRINGQVTEHRSTKGPYGQMMCQG